MISLVDELNTRLSATVLYKQDNVDCFKKKEIARNDRQKLLIVGIPWM